MPPVFTKSLADSLNRTAAVEVCEAADGEAVVPNKVYIAPGGQHMVLRRSDSGENVIALNENPPEHNCRPSVNVLFRSVATYHGGKILSVVMTGMGEDGCEGVRVMKRQGCIALTQEESTCVVYGMPRAVDDAGLSDEQVPLDQLADRIAALVRNPATAL
jgi:two-component system chemotaxis response regulator CheB